MIRLPLLNVDVGVLGVTQPKVICDSKLQIGGLPVERLMNLLTALDHDVDIVIRRMPRSRKAGRISVAPLRFDGHAQIGHDSAHIGFKNKTRPVPPKKPR